jgi:hypothetical protein
MSTVSRIFYCVVFLICSLPSFSPAQGEPAWDGDSSRPFGLMVFIQMAPHYNSLTSYTDGGYSVSLGFGINFSSRFQMALQVYTGREMIPAGSEKPVDGWLPVGGASLEATFFFTSGAGVRPYASAGCALWTISGLNGYNGGGLYAEGGVEWDFSRYFSLRCGGQYGVTRFHDPTGEAFQAVGFTPFTLRCAGAALRLSFYPSLVP